MEEIQEEAVLADVLEWVIAHKEDIEAMDRINRATYPFTSKFQEKVLGIDRVPNG